MAKRRRVSRRDGEAIVWGVIFASYFVYQKLLENPLLGSFIVGVLVALLVLAILLIGRSRRVRRANLLARDSFYLDYSPKEFEEATAEMFRRLGYKTKVTSYSGDKGLDVLLVKNEEKSGVQCKRYQPSKNIGPGPIREFSGSLEGAGLSKGFFVATTGFTEAAKEAADNSSFQIVLISGEKLGELKNRVENRINTDLIQKRWWGILKKWQKGLLLGMFFAGIMMLVSSLVYVVIISAGLNAT